MVDLVVEAAAARHLALAGLIRIECSERCANFVALGAIESDLFSVDQELPGLVQFATVDCLLLLRHEEDFIRE